MHVFRGKSPFSGSGVNQHYSGVKTVSTFRCGCDGYGVFSTGIRLALAAHRSLPGVERKTSRVLDLFEVPYNMRALYRKRFVIQGTKEAERGTKLTTESLESDSHRTDRRSTLARGGHPLQWTVKLAWVRGGFCSSWSTGRTNSWPVKEIN